MLCINDLDFWVRVVQILLTVTAIGVAIWAANSWYRNLRNERADECISAVYEIHGLVGRCLSLHKRGAPEERYWSAYDKVWDSWRQFSRAREVMDGRYRNMNDVDPKQIADLIEKLEKRDTLTANGEALHAELERIAKSVKDKLK
jgi:hypothetical protein